MSKFRTARNQITTGLSELGYVEEARQAVAGILTPFMINRIRFTSEEVAKAAIEMCAEHHPNVRFNVRKQDAYWFSVSTWDV